MIRTALNSQLTLHPVNLAARQSIDDELIFKSIDRKFLTDHDVIERGEAAQGIPDRFGSQ